MDAVLVWVRSAVVYVILISAVMYLLPDNQYRKYVQLFAGLLMILIVMEPVAEVLAGEDLITWFYEKAFAWQTGNESSQVLEQIGVAGDSILMNVYEEQLEKQLAAQLSGEGYETEGAAVEISENGIESISVKVYTSAELTLTERSEEEKRLAGLLAELYEIPDSDIQVDIK